MAEECGALFLRLGLSPDKTIAALQGLPTKITKVVQSKRGSREAYRDLVVAIIVNLWKKEAMTFFEKTRVERVMRTVITAVVPGVDVPTIAYGPAIEAADEEWRALRRKEKQAAMEKDNEAKAKKKDKKHDKKDKEDGKSRHRSRHRSRTRSLSRRVQSPIQQTARGRSRPPGRTGRQVPAALLTAARAKSQSHAPGRIAQNSMSGAEAGRQEPEMDPVLLQIMRLSPTSRKRLLDSVTSGQDKTVDANTKQGFKAPDVDDHGALHTTEAEKHLTPASPRQSEDSFSAPKARPKDRDEFVG